MNEKSNAFEEAAGALKQVRNLILSGDDLKQNMSQAVGEIKQQVHTAEKTLATGNLLQDEVRRSLSGLQGDIIAQGRELLGTMERASQRQQAATQEVLERLAELRRRQEEDALALKESITEQRNLLMRHMLNARRLGIISTILAVAILGCIVALLFRS